MKKIRIEEKKKCEICGKPLKDWYRIVEVDKYFCSLKHLNQYEKEHK